jgi:hypothetical protein
MAMNARLLRPLATGFDPRRIAGLSVWLDPADSATVSLSSGEITEIRDKSGNSRHATQTTANSRPTYQTAARNGLNVARFDGTNDFLSVATTISLGPFSVFAVAVHTTGKFQGLICDRNGTTAGYFGCIYNNNNFVAVARVGQTSTASNRSVALNAVNIPVWLSDGMSGTTVTCTIRANGQEDTTARSATALQTNPNALTIGSGGEGTFDVFVGDICEIVIYNRRLALTETQRVERYLARKWGVALA